jgi:hypothetical protein
MNGTATEHLYTYRTTICAPSDRKQLTIMFQTFASTGLVTFDNRPTILSDLTVQIAFYKRFFARLEQY